MHSFLLSIFMKQLTCKQIGGVCDMPFQGETSGEVAKAAADHMTELAKTDPAHQKAYDKMAAIYEDTERHAQWQKDFQKMWDAAPEVQ
jgi:DNA-binding SARP family transcriptional activator